jgi:transcription antitermination factor NusG
VYGGERQAAAECRSAGFDVFAPTIFKPATRARRNAVGAIIPARPASAVPLFPNYIFSRFRVIDYWRYRGDLPSVAGLLSLAPDAPTPMPDRAISLIRGMCGADDCYHEDGDTPNTLVGALLRLLSGPFSGFEGICDWSGDGKARMPVTFCGRPCPITVDQEMVEVV